MNTTTQPIEDSQQAGCLPRSCSAGFEECPTLDSVWRGKDFISAFTLARDIFDNYQQGSGLLRSLCHLIVDLEERGKIPTGSFVPGSDETRTTLEEVLEYSRGWNARYLTGLRKQVSLISERMKQATGIQHPHPEIVSLDAAAQKRVTGERCSCGSGVDGGVSENQITVLPND